MPIPVTTTLLCFVDVFFDSPDSLTGCTGCVATDDAFPAVNAYECLAITNYNAQIVND